MAQTDRFTPTKARSRVAVAHRTGQSPEVITEARRDLAEANIAACIERALAKAPPLSEAQVERLAARLRGVEPDASPKRDDGLAAKRRSTRRTPPPDAAPLFDIPVGEGEHQHWTARGADGDL